MVRITEELVRKRSEHNECEICTLEELSLHQENIEVIEHLQNWCRHLQILLLQGNIISRIENLHKLKRLQYLNLALNNIEVIENLDKCESLEKLDLTVNFIGDLESVCSLQNNTNLKELYLTGNPCTDYTGYRIYVLAKVPQLQNLDSKEITKSERLKALQLVDFVEPQMLADQNKYLEQRWEQRERLSRVRHEEISDEVFWKEVSEHSPEVRVEMARRQRRAQQKDENNKDNRAELIIRLFNKEGRPFNINQPKLKFKLMHEDSDEVVLDVEIYKYLDTNLVEVDLQPTYVRITVKGKVFQLVLPEEICTDKSVAQRSQITGHLMLRMPKINAQVHTKLKNTNFAPQQKVSSEERKLRREFLEIGPPDRLTQICNVVENNKNGNVFVDNSDVPPLE